MSKFKFNPDKNIDGPGGISNDTRADWAEIGVAAFREQCSHNDDPLGDEHIQDLICDLGHLADREGLNFEQLVQNGVRTWQDER